MLNSWILYISIIIFQLSSILIGILFLTANLSHLIIKTFFNFNSEGDEPYVGRVVYMFEAKMGYPTVHLEVRELQYLVVRAKRPLQATLSVAVGSLSAWIAPRRSCYCNNAFSSVGDKQKVILW